VGIRLSPGAKNIVLTAAITALVVAVCTSLFWFFIWPRYRDGHRRSLAAHAVLVASGMTPAIAERLLRRDGRSISEGLQVPLKPPVVAGRVAADGSVVVSAELDAGHSLTVVMSPQIGHNEVLWTCGVADEAQLRYVASSCHRVVRVP
jgi:hypothetical protein